MSKPLFNPPQNYSGVTIQIMNPAVNVGQNRCIPYDCNNSASEFVNYPPAYFINSEYRNTPEMENSYITRPQIPQNTETQFINNPGGSTFAPTKIPQAASEKVVPAEPQAYPANYYLNNYNYGSQVGTGIDGNVEGGANINNNAKPYNPYTEKNITNPKENGNKNFYDKNSEINASKNRQFSNNENSLDLNSENFVPETDSHVIKNYNPSAYKHYADTNSQKEEDMTTSKKIIDDLTQRDEAAQEEKKNTQEKKIVALTDEYIKSLENYLNNPNDEIRLMASKEILTRLDEDKDRYDDAALNALLNKMLQDPSKLIRIAALSAFSSQLASGNNYTIKLLTNIQSNPNADKEDVLQAADILLKMSAGTEVKRIPNPKVKENQENK